MLSIHLDLCGADDAPNIFRRLCLLFGGLFDHCSISHSIGRRFKRFNSGSLVRPAFPHD